VRSPVANSRDERTVQNTRLVFRWGGILAFLFMLYFHPLITLVVLLILILFFRGILKLLFGAF
jgi:hypothetical protein